MKAIPKDAQRTILADFGKYEVAFPLSVHDLGSEAEREINKLIEEFSKIRFGNNPKNNRDAIRKINQRITRFIDLGLSFSTISEWGAEK